MSYVDLDLLFDSHRFTSGTYVNDINIQEIFLALLKHWFCLMPFYITWHQLVFHISIFSINKLNQNFARNWVGIFFFQKYKMVATTRHSFKIKPYKEMLLKLSSQQLSSHLKEDKEKIILVIPLQCLHFCFGQKSINGYK